MSFATFPTSLPYFEELHNQALLDGFIARLSSIDEGVNTLKISEDKVASHAFMDAFEKTANLTFTTNGALTHATTCDDLLDLYYGIQAVNLKSESTDMYRKAYTQDPDFTMHIIFYARSIHRGKSVILPFFKAYCWVLKNHPQTALANLHVLCDGTVRTGAQLSHLRKCAEKKTEAEEDGWDVIGDEIEERYKVLERRDFKTHGYWKDLCTLLTIYCQGELDGPTNKTFLALEWPRKEFDWQNAGPKRVKKENRICNRKQMIPELALQDAQKYIRLAEEHNQEQKLLAQKQRRNTRHQRQKVVSDLLENDRTYRALHFTIARLFADQLKTDMKQLDRNHVMKSQKTLKGRYALGFNLSLAAKWAPTLGASHDKHTLLATTIAEILFPPDQFQDKDEPRAHYLNKVRELYRKDYLAPLRSALDLTEHYMDDKKWDKVDLGHASSVCLQKNMKHFFKHAPDNVIQYMKEVAVGKKKVSGETLGPHQLVHRFRIRNKPNPDLEDLFALHPGLQEKYKIAEEQLMNGQWETLMQGLRDTSLLNSTTIEESKKKAVHLGECLAICDVSGSMKYNKFTTDPELMPLNAAVGLSLVITNLAKPPFNGGVITFSHNPKLFKVDTTAPFTTQARTIIKSPMGYNTDVAKVFTKVILPMAIKHKLAPEDMVKRLFIFSDMEFDDPQSRVGKFDGTTQEFIKKQFNDAGYEMPEIIWWNLCADGSYSSFSKMNAPVTKDDVNVSLISGFSASMVKTFLDGELYDGDERPEKISTMKDQQKGKKISDTNISTEKKKETVMDFVKRVVYHESFSGIKIID